MNFPNHKGSTMIYIPIQLTEKVLVIFYSSILSHTQVSSLIFKQFLILFYKNHSPYNKILTVLKILIGNMKAFPVNIDSCFVNNKNRTELIPRAKVNIQQNPATSNLIGTVTHVRVSKILDYPKQKKERKIRNYEQTVVDSLIHQMEQKDSNHL